MSEKSKTRTELDLLSALEEGEVVTQMVLSRRISVSVGLVNALIRRALHKGLVKARSAPRKRYAYYLTPRGFVEKSRLVAEYLETSLDFFRHTRQEYDEIFSRLEMSDMKRVALAGCGELAEIALLSCKESNVELVAILDRESNRPTFHDVNVIRSVDDDCKIDAIIITDSKQPQKCFDEVRKQFDDSQVMAPAFLHISRNTERHEIIDDGDSL